MNRFKIIPLLFLIALLSFGFMRSDSDIYFKISKGIDIFGRIYKEVSLNYVDEVDPQEFMLAGIKGMLTSLDPYTVYIDKNLQNDIDVITKGKYGGIGATVGVRNGRITIVDLLEGYSAQRQGIRIGDIIVEVEGKKFTKENYDELGGYLKGDPGTTVSVVVEREGTPENIKFDLLREEVQINNLTYFGFVPEESNNVYLKLSGFSRSAGEEIKKALFELREQKEIRSIILDLRGNPGGLLDAAIDVSEKFLNKGQLVVSVIGRDSTKEQKYFSTEEPIAGDSRLAVLVNGGSASASEIVAGAVQDHDRGIIVGTQSFGKGLVQTLLPLSYNTSLKITTAKYYTPSGRCIQKVDYSHNNTVFTNSGNIENLEFQTDNLRKVYSGGGIKPDTTVSNESESNQVTDLMAQGMFFKYATNYYNSNSNLEMLNLNEDEIFDNFLEYLDRQGFEYTSKAEKLTAQLLDLAKDEKQSEEILNRISDLKDDFIALKNRELNQYKKDIVHEIRKELASRIKGRSGRIIESLRYDKQFDSALKILYEDSEYNAMLSFAK